MQKKFIVPMLVLAFVFAVSVSGFSADKKVLSIATGGTGGTYYAIDGGISKLVAEYMPGYKLVVQSTGASIENAHLVANKKVDFAIVMPGRLFCLYRRPRVQGQGQVSQPASGDGRSRLPASGRGLEVFGY